MRKHPVYIPDQVSWGRSGFDVSVCNEVSAGEKPVSALPNFWRFSDQVVWAQFRFGLAAGQSFPDSQYPLQAVVKLSHQAIPDLNYVLPNPNPNIAATAKLAAQLKGAVVMGHSQGLT